MRRTSWIVCALFSLTGCLTEQVADGGSPSDVDVDVEPACATPRVETLHGTAGRERTDYPDDIAATVTWQRVGSTGCIDRYTATGAAHYAYAVPGAPCGQQLDPVDHAIGAADGTLEIDRSTSPATYRGRGATAWPVTWTCHEDDETIDSMTFDGGGVWFEAAGTVGDGVVGEHVEPDGRQCGRGEATTPCTYRWAFAL